MPTTFKKPRSVVPKEFNQEVLSTIRRIEVHRNVIGVIFFLEEKVRFCTLPENVAQTLNTKLPPLNLALHRAVTEIISASLVTKQTNKSSRHLYVEVAQRHQLWQFFNRDTDALNVVNPMVDRIMDNESVDGVLMTNSQGAPILTNMHTVLASNGTIKLTNLGSMCIRTIKNLDPLDDLLVIRILTAKKLEILLAPHADFNIIVLQQSRSSKKNQ